MYKLLLLLCIAVGIKGVPTLPEQISLSYWGNPTEMHLTFVNFPGVNDGVSNTVNRASYWANYQNATVSIGTVRGSLDRVLPFTTTEIMTDVPEFWSGQIWKVVLDQLTPGTRYFYKISFLSTNSFEYGFRTPANDGTSSQKIALVADVSTLNSGVKTITNIASRVGDLDYLLHAGDIAYATLEDDGGTGNQSYVDLYGRQIQQVAAQIPYMVSPGNHEENEWNFRPYRHRWNMPGVQEYRYWYSFDWKNVHIISFSTEHSLSANSPQYTWLVNDLNNRPKTTEFTFVVGHRPIYSSGRGNPSDMDIRNTLEPILMQYGVDMIITGHAHIYERTHPVYGGVAYRNYGSGNSLEDPYLDPRVPISVVVGNGGVDQAKFLDPQPNWSAYRVSKYGYSVIEILENRTLHFQSFLNNGDAGDSFYLRKSMNNTTPTLTSTIPIPGGSSTSEEDKSSAISFFIPIFTIVFMLSI